MQVIVATGNKGKLCEFERIFAPLGISVVAQGEVCPGLQVEETGTTFAENAFLKTLCRCARRAPRRLFGAIWGRRDALS